MLHPSARALAVSGFLTGKIVFAERLQQEVSSERFRYTSIITAGFLDYILVKGYTGIDPVKYEAKLYDGAKPK